MKDFIKWLGVDEKIAKVAVWTLIVMVLLIIFNAFLDSIGVKYYKLNVENLSKLNISKLVEYLCAWIMTILNFLSIVLIVFRLKDFKKIFKYSILYLIMNILVNAISNYTVSQVFIIFFIIAFCYLFSGKKWKYALYAIISIIINFVVQYITYIYKIQFIDYNAVNTLERLILSIDCYLMLIFIIAVKEVFLKKRGEI